MDPYRNPRQITMVAGAALLTGGLLGAAVGWFAKPVPNPQTKIVYRDKPQDPGLIDLRLVEKGVTPPVPIPSTPEKKEPAAEKVDLPAPPKTQTRPVPTNVMPLPAVKGNLPPMSPFMSPGLEPSPQVGEDNDAKVRSIAATLGVRIIETVRVGSNRRVFTLLSNSVRAGEVVKKLRASLGPLASVGEPYTSERDNPEVERQEKRLRDLRSERLRLLIDYFPDAPAVKEIERQIADAEQELSGTPRPVRIAVTVGV